jgi:hypothetical protein
MLQIIETTLQIFQQVVSLLSNWLLLSVTKGENKDFKKYIITET